MLKKIVSTILAAAMLATVASAAPSDMQTAIPSPHAIYVDGAKANVAAYTIGGNNYFKLRDIAAIVNGSEKQFEVDWNNDQQRIDLTSGKPYTTVGGELGAISSANQSAKASTAVVYKDGSKANYAGYNIKNNNYYKLRDVSHSFDIGVEWDGANQRVDIITTEGYVPEGQQTTEEPESEPETPVTEPETPVTEPEEPATEPETPQVNIPTITDKFPEAHGVIDEYSSAYQKFLDECNENTIDVSISYKIVNALTNKPVRASIQSAVVMLDDSYYNPDSPFSENFGLVKLIQSNSDGTGSFTLKVPQSLYQKMQGKGSYFSIYPSQNYYYIDDTWYTMGGSIIMNYATQGYRLEVQLMPDFILNR